MNRTQAHLLNRINSLSEELQRNLRSLSRDAQDAATNIGKGERPFGSPATLGRTVAPLIENHARLEALVELAAPLGLSSEDIVTAYRGDNRNFWTATEYPQEVVTVSIPSYEAHGAAYTLTLPDGSTAELGDGQDEYHTLAGIIDELFPTEEG